MQRTKINVKKFQPQWEGTFENWSRNWVNKHFWKVQHIHCTKEDSLQECALIFARCVKSYNGKLDNPAWFMALYKTAVARDWITFAQKESQRRDIELAHAADLTDGNYGPLITHLRLCAAEIRDVMGMLASAPNEVCAALITAKSRSALDRKTRRLTKASDELVCHLAQSYAALRLENRREASAALVELSKLLD